MQVFTFNVSPPRRTANNSRDTCTVCCNLIDGFQAAINEIIKLEEITWRISAYCKLSEYHQFGTRCACLINGCNDL